LFDYLPRRYCRAVIRAGLRLLKPSGRFFFTNVARGNPYRPWIEYCANWCLIERSEQCLADLIDDAAGHGLAPDITIDRDPTGLALFATVEVP
jgi:hypothetical protein